MRFLLLLLSLSCVLPSFAEEKLILIRHGQATSNVSATYNSNPNHPGYQPADLTDKGKEEVKKTAINLLSQGFNKNNVAALYVSPLPRTKQTAEILAQLGLVSPDKIFEDKRLIELQAGDLEGKPTFPEWLPAYAQQYHAESPNQVKERVQDFYQFILHQHPHGNIIVVSHTLPLEQFIELISHQHTKLKTGEAKVLPLN